MFLIVSQGFAQPTMAAVNGYALGEDLNGCFHVTLQLLRKVFLWGSLKLAGAIIPGAGGTPAAAEVDWGNEGQGIDLHR